MLKAICPPDVGGIKLPLETRFITWNTLDHPSELLSLGERIEAVVNDQYIGEIDYRKQRNYPEVRWFGYWLSRLPLLEDIWPTLHAQYAEGSVIEVEFLGYCNPYVARARTPEGFIIELLINDLHPRRESLGFSKKLYIGERIELLIRKLRKRSFWVQRYTLKSNSDYLAESGCSPRRLRV